MPLVKGDNADFIEIVNRWSYVTDRSSERILDILVRAFWLGKLNCVLTTKNEDMRLFMLRKLVSIKGPFSIEHEVEECHEGEYVSLLPKVSIPDDPLDLSREEKESLFNAYAICFFSHFPKDIQETMKLLIKVEAGEFGSWYETSEIFPHPPLNIIWPQAAKALMDLKPVTSDEKADSGNSSTHISTPSKPSKRPSETELDAIICSCFPDNKMPGISKAEEIIRDAARNAGFAPIQDIRVFLDREKYKNMRDLPGRKPKKI